MSESIIGGLKSIINSSALSPITICGNCIEHCGCILSKWIIVEFSRFSGFEEFLFVAFIYMEPFVPTDHVYFAIKLNDAPQSILNLYHLASDCSERVINYDCLELSIPYVYKNACAVIRKNVCTCDTVIASRVVSPSRDLIKFDLLLSV